MDWKKSKISLIDAMIIILFLMAVYFILTRIFGHSATDLTIAITLFTLLGGMMYRLKREVGELKIKTINSFGRLNEDIRQIEDGLSQIKQLVELNFFRLGDSQFDEDLRGAFEQKPLSIFLIG
ncbi:hypothetical protein HYY74_06105 [Candidatus Woesearchaeota archaeon]|nr:hypothetical protein [Candidatus Woesearchaeota archaeon]